MKWAYGDQDQFKKLMRYLYDNAFLKKNLDEYDKINKKILSNYEFIKDNFCSKSIAKKFKNLLTRID